MLRGALLVCLLASVAPARGADAPAAPGGGGSPSPPAAGDPVVEGRRLVGELKRRLTAALTAALRGGPASAVAVCRTEAPAIAQTLAANGAVLGRATRKPRNPANRAAGWQAEALSHFERLATGGAGLDGASWSRSLPDGRTGYAEPLVVQPLCVTCHGPVDAMAPDLRAALAAQYPDDRATGYAVGDLRGIAWVELPATAGRSVKKP